MFCFPQTFQIPYTAPESPLWPAACLNAQSGKHGPNQGECPWLVPSLGCVLKLCPRSHVCSSSFPPRGRYPKSATFSCPFPQMDPQAAPASLPSQMTPPPWVGLRGKALFTWSRPASPVLSPEAQPTSRRARLLGPRGPRQVCQLKRHEVVSQLTWHFFSL